MMSTQLSQIAKKAKLDRKARFTSLAHLLTPEFLRKTGADEPASGGRQSMGRAPSSLEAS